MIERKGEQSKLDYILDLANLRTWCIRARVAKYISAKKITSM